MSAIRLAMEMENKMIYLKLEGMGMLLSPKFSV